MSTLSEVDECTRGIHDCKSDERCLDLPYGFTCETICSEGYEVTRGVCTGKKCYADVVRKTIFLLIYHAPINVHRGKFVPVYKGK